MFVARNQSLGIILKKGGNSIVERKRELTQEKDGDLIKLEPEASYLRAGVEVDWRQSRFVKF